jgi:hypothetical protein
VHIDQRLLLTMIASYHSNFIDGFGALSAFKGLMAVPSARLEHLRRLGVA